MNFSWTNDFARNDNVNIILVDTTTTTTTANQQPRRRQQQEQQQQQQPQPQQEQQLQEQHPQQDQHDIAVMVYAYHNLLQDRRLNSGIQNLNNSNNSDNESNQQQQQQELQLQQELDLTKSRQLTTWRRRIQTEAHKIFTDQGAAAVWSFAYQTQLNKQNNRNNNMKSTKESRKYVGDNNDNNNINDDETGVDENDKTSSASTTTSNNNTIVDQWSSEWCLDTFAWVCCMILEQGMSDVATQKAYDEYRNRFYKMRRVLKRKMRKYNLEMAIHKYQYLIVTTSAATTADAAAKTTKTAVDEKQKKGDLSWFCTEVTEKLSNEAESLSLIFHFLKQRPDIMQQLSSTSSDLSSAAAS